MEGMNRQDMIDDFGKKMKKKINVYFYMVVIGMVITFASLVALQTLQTSINIEGNTGSIAITSAYIGSIIYGLFVAPAVLRKFGIGVSLILADFSLAIFGLSNFDSELYFLLPGAIVSAVGRATLLPVTSAACINLAKEFDRYGSQATTVYVNRYQGRLYAIFNTVSIIGNSVSFLILYAGDRSTQDDSSEESILNSTSTPSMNSSSSTPTNYNPYEYCGVNDCQDPDIVEDNIDQYVPPKQSSIYILAGVSTCMALIGALIHGTIYPGVGAFARKFVMDESSESPAQTASIHSKSDKCVSNGKKVPSTAINTCHANESFEHDGSEADVSNGYTVNEAKKSNEKEEQVQPENDKKVQESYVTTLKKTLLFFLRFDVLLLSLTPLRNGMIIGFTFSDLTRAYASCVFGVEKTSLIAVTFGIIGIPTSFIYGIVVGRIGRNPIMLLGYLIEMSVYVGCYVWEPDPSTIALIFLVFIGLGTVNGIMKPAVSTAYNEYFPDDQHIAVIAWNICILLGSGLQYGLSTVMCVREKIILTSSFATLSFLTYGLNELLQQRKYRRRARNDAETTLQTRF